MSSDCRVESAHSSKKTPGMDRAKREIERERAQALESIRREAVELSIAAASHLLGRKVDADEDRRVVREFLDRAERAEA